MARPIIIGPNIQDNSNNLSALSPISAGVTVTQILTGDIGSGQVNTGNIGSGQVQTGNIGSGQVTTGTIATTAVTQSIYDTDGGSQSTTSTAYVNYSGVSATMNVSSTSSLILVLVMGDVQVTQSGGIDGYAAGSLAVNIAGTDVRRRRWLDVAPHDRAGHVPGHRRAYGWTGPARATRRIRSGSSPSSVARRPPCSDR